MLKHKIRSSTAIVICLLTQFGIIHTAADEIIFCMLCKSSETGKSNMTNMAALHIFVADHYKNR